MKHQAVLENLKVKKAGNMMLEPWYIYLDQKIENAFDFSDISLSVLNILLLKIEVTYDLASQGNVELCSKNYLIAHSCDERTI